MATTEQDVIDTLRKITRGKFFVSEKYYNAIQIAIAALEAEQIARAQEQG